MLENTQTEDDTLDTELDSEVEADTIVEAEVEEADYEPDAEKQGWVPKEKYKGDPKKWVDAKTFVERGEQFRPMLHAKYKEAETKLAEYGRKFEEQEVAIERSNRVSAKLFERAKQEALEEIKRDQKKAWEQGDEALYDKLDKRRDSLEEEFKIEEPKPKAAEPGVDPYVVKFQQENSWFGKDFTLTQAAQFHDARLAREQAYLTPEQRHAEVKKLVIEEFPNKFENPNRQVKMGLGAGRNPSKPTNKKGWDTMPESDKKMAQGFMRSTGKSKEEYAKAYWEMIKEEGNE